LHLKSEKASGASSSRARDKIFFLLISYLLFIDYIKFIIYINKSSYYIIVNIKEFFEKKNCIFDLHIFINLLKILFLLFNYFCLYIIHFYYSIVLNY
jgi:hypothetical protein